MKKSKGLKAVISAVALSLVSAVAISGVSAAEYKGDVDGNGDVTINDVVKLSKYLVKADTLSSDSLKYADMNNDGKINVFDLVLVRRTVLGINEKIEIVEPTEETTEPATTAATTAVTTTETTVTTVTDPVETTAETTVTTEETTTSEVTTTEETTVSEVTTTEETTASEVTTTEETTTSEVTTTEETTVSEVTTTEKTTVSEVTTTEETTVSKVTTTTSTTDIKTKVSVAIPENAGAVKEISFRVDSTSNYSGEVIISDGEGNSKSYRFYDENTDATDGIKAVDGVVTITIDPAENATVVQIFQYWPEDATLDITDVKVVTEEGEITLPAETTAVSEVTTTTETTVSTTSETTTSTTAETTTAETTTAETTTAETTTSGKVTSISVAQNATEKIEIDSEKDMNTVELELDTSADFILHIYVGNNWNAWCNIDCTNGILTYNTTDIKNIESVVIENDKVVITFAEGVKGDIIGFTNNFGTVNITVNKIEQASATDIT